MKNKKYIYLSADAVAHIKQNYYDEIKNIENEIYNSKRESGIINALILDIESELKYIKIAIKNTILRIKILDNNIDIEENIISGLRQNINENAYTNKNVIASLKGKINELEKMKGELIKLEKRKRELTSRKKELKRNRKSAKNSLSVVNKNIMRYEDNIESINFSLIKVDDAFIYSNGYIREKTFKPKVKKIIKLK